MISDWPEGNLHLSSFTGTKKNTNILKTPAPTGENFNTPWSHTPTETAMQRAFQTIHSLNYIQLKVVLHGNSILEAGMLVKLDLPNIGRGSGFFEGSEAKWENRLDNLWIITSLKHILELPRNTYRTHLILTNTMTHTSRELQTYEAPGKVGPRRQYGSPHTG